MADMVVGGFELLVVAGKVRQVVFELVGVKRSVLAEKGQQVAGLSANEFSKKKKKKLAVKPKQVHLASRMSSYVRFAMVKCGGERGSFFFI